MGITDTIEPKSDQLNADDLINGPKIITVQSVKIVGGDQPVSISFDGDNGKPYKPCKSMRRVMVKAWGPSESTYIGRSMKLYCDPNVTFGKEKVGGIRISHMSHIPNRLEMALTVTRARRKTYVVEVLESDPEASKKIIEDLKAEFDELIKKVDTDSAEKARTFVEQNEGFEGLSKAVARLRQLSTPENEEVDENGVPY